MVEHDLAVGEFWEGHGFSRAERTRNNDGFGR